MVPAAHHIGARFPTFAPDLPGYGRSPRPWEVYGVEDLAGYLQGFCDAVGIERAIFVSLSFGCQIVVELADRVPDLVAAGVLIGPTIDVEARTAVKQVFRLMLDGPLEPPGLFPVILRDYLRFGVRRGAITLWHALADDVSEKLPRVGAPMLVVRGENDIVVPRRWCLEMTELMPDAEFVEIPGAAHGANFSHPEMLALLLEAFALRRGLTVDPVRS
jgi:pimeloyl-ACP methyl ester carboxylesterase